MTSTVDLYWLPLGAGAHIVRLNGRAYEALASRLQHRTPCDLYHSALQIHVPDGRFVIEMAPVRDRHGDRRGAVQTGPVGARFAGRLKLFRYEIRCWRDGQIDDIASAVDSPQRVSEDPHTAQRILQLAPQVPSAVWGRDHAHTGEMWNSNSVIAWLLASAGIDTKAITAPTGGRAPGWQAGLRLAVRKPPPAPASEPSGASPAARRPQPDAPPQ